MNESKHAHLCDCVLHSCCYLYESKQRLLAHCLSLVNVIIGIVGVIVLHVASRLVILARIFKKVLVVFILFKIQYIIIIRAA